MDLPAKLQKAKSVPLSNDSRAAAILLKDNNYASKRVLPAARTIKLHVPMVCSSQIRHKYQTPGRAMRVPSPIRMVHEVIERVASRYAILTNPS
jgi:hypothetical protein